MIEKGAEILSFSARCRRQYEAGRAASSGYRDGAEESI